MQTALFDTMSQRVTAQRDAELAKAQEEADAILAEADRRVEALRSEALAKAKAEVDLYVKGARQMATAEAEREALSAHQALADDVLAKAEAELQRIAGSAEFGPILDALLGELVPEAPAGSVILAPAAHADRCKAWLTSNGHDSFQVETSGEIADGVAAQDASRSFRITNSLSTRFAILERDARKQCLKTLFDGKGGS